MASGRGQSLTPLSKAQEVADVGMWDGLLSGACAAIPSTVAVWYGTNYSPSFAKYTNWQSRTALVIMPPLFMFAMASEQKITHRMREMADEKEHSTNVSKWAEDLHMKEEEMKQSRDLLVFDSKSREQINVKKFTGTNEERERQLSEIYKTSVENSGIRIIEGDKLGLHHKFANFWQENPFKILIAMSVPTVGIIFKTRSSQSHLQLQSMVMHTRVLGQSSVIFMLLTLVGFKGYMDINGKFVTEMDAQSRVEDMKSARLELLERLQQDKDNNEYLENLKKRAKKEREAEKEAKKLQQKLVKSRKLNEEQAQKIVAKNE